MKYDFETIYDRTGMDASAFDAIGKNQWGFEPGAPKEGFDAIPMWVADMNFATCPAVTDAIIRRAQHPIYGYFAPAFCAAERTPVRLPADTRRRQRTAL